MHPILFEIAGFTVHSYGALIALGFFTSLGLVHILGVRSGLDTKKLIDFAFYLLFVGFVSSRILFVITRFDYFMSHPMEILHFWEGGFVLLGGLIGALGFGLWYVRHFRLNAWKVADVGFPALTLAHAFGRLGCFSAGCCYGKPTDLAWGVSFQSDLVDPVFRGVPLHPTQLYESFSLLIVLCGLLYVFYHKKFDGQVALTYLIAYPVIRSVIEIFRGDQIRGFVIEDILSTSQFISLLVFAGACFLLIKRLKEVQK